MEETAIQLTVLFEEPFWIGLYERESNGRYEACKLLYGAEPKDYEVYALLLHPREPLVFSPPIASATAVRKRINPKRMQRDIGKQLAETGVGTKAQQALKLQQEQNKLVKRTRTKAQREAEQARRLELHREKRKEKHKGH